jgi:UDP-glucose 4-epimerase
MSGAIETVQNLTGRTIATREVPRRAADPAELVGDSTRLKSVLGWQPKSDKMKRSSRPLTAGNDPLMVLKRRRVFSDQD